LQEDDDFLQRARFGQTPNLEAVGPEHQRVGLVPLHLEFFYKRGAAIFCVQVCDDESLGQLRERTVRVRVPLENPAVPSSDRVEHVNENRQLLRLRRRQRLGQIRDGLFRPSRAGAEHQPAGDEREEFCCRKFHPVTFFL
jgi:hypothetical protein